MTSSKDDKLKPCPFCGGDDLRPTEVEDFGPDESWSARVECRPCEIMGPPPPLYYDTEDEALAAARVAWNTRASEGDNNASR